MKIVNSAMTLHHINAIIKKEKKRTSKCMKNAKKKITYEDIDQNAGVKISLRKYVNKCIEIIKKVYGSKSHVNQ